MKVYDRLYARREMLQSTAGLAGVMLMASSQIVNTFQETKEIYESYLSNTEFLKLLFDL